MADALDTAQNAVGGGGRYDGWWRISVDLRRRASASPSASTGFLLACGAEGAFAEDANPVQVFVVDVAGGQSAVVLCDRLRQAGLGVDRAFDGRSMKAQMKRPTAPGPPWR